MGEPARRKPPSGPRAMRTAGPSTTKQYQDEIFWPVPEVDGRLSVIATLVHTRYRETDYGSRHEGLFICEGEEGRFKLWGTIPVALEDAVEEEQRRDRTATLKGSLVSFDAAVTRTKKDECFGTFKRPTKAQLLVSGRDGRERS